MGRESRGVGQGGGQVAEPVLGQFIGGTKLGGNVGEGGNIQNNSLRSLFAEQQALGRFKCVEFNSTPSLATLDSEWYPFNFMNPLPDESALKIH